MENLGKRTETTDASITNRIQEMEEKMSDLEYTIEEIDTSVKENAKKLIEHQLDYTRKNIPAI